MRLRLSELGIELEGFGHIIPWIIGDARRAVRIASLIRAQGIDVRAVRPPSVPEGTARLRLTVTALHDDKHIDEAVEAIKRVLQEVSSPRVGWE
jgi:7-keto-8-aminopelargonate synthetase-like enzyme